MQQTTTAVPVPGQAREDWKIIRALSEVRREGDDGRTGISEGLGRGLVTLVLPGRRVWFVAHRLGSRGC